jgi:hypothetical protein
VSIAQQRALEARGLANVSSAISRMEEFKKRKAEVIDPSKFRSGKAWKPAVYGVHGESLDAVKAANYVTLLFKDFST